MKNIAAQPLIRPLVLIVDDVPDIVEEMIHMLALLDLPAVGAGSIGAGLALLVEHPAVRVIVCDLRLPGENGADIAARVAAHPALQGRAVTFLFMSGDTERVETLAAAADHVVLTKPVDPPLLIDSIVAALDADGGTP